jgi:hypothetical protein
MRLVVAVVKLAVAVPTVHEQRDAHVVRPTDLLCGFEAPDQQLATTIEVLTIHDGSRPLLCGMPGKRKLRMHTHKNIFNLCMNT